MHNAHGVCIFCFFARRNRLFVSYVQSVKINKANKQFPKYLSSVLLGNTVVFKNLNSFNLFNSILKTLFCFLFKRVSKV